LDSQLGEGAEEAQLLAYTRLVENDLIDVAGLQGFPWYPTEEGDSRSPVISADTFAPAYLVDEMAKSLGVNEVLLNTGSFRHSKADNGGDVTVTTLDRQKTLNSIVQEVSKLHSMRYAVTVNVFAENKFDTKEGVDWSYWQPGAYTSSEHTALFTTFVRDIKKMNGDISIFDSREK
jgi:hypothetical protein